MYNDEINMTSHFHIPIDVLESNCKLCFGICFTK